MSPSDLDAIRRRAKEQPTLGLVSEHAQAVADRATLLAYLDETAEQIRELGEHVGEILETNRVLLAMRLVQDGHAATMGEALDLTRDLAKVAAMYWVPA
jgi:hypothetical protein